MPVRLTVISSDGAEARFVEFDSRSIRIGRESDCDLRLPFPAVSGHHCTIFSEDGEVYQIRDDGSTNGTRLNGEFLVSQKPETLHLDACVKIAGLRIDIDTNPLAGSAPPIAHTGTLVRMMLTETLDDAEAEQARITVLKGPGAGNIVYLPDEFDALSISNAPSALLQIPNLSTPLKLTPDGDGFAISLMSEQDAPPRPRERAAINGQPLEGTHHLASNDHIEVGRCVLRFFDPLEDLLIELDAQIPVRRDDTGPGETAADLAALEAADGDAHGASELPVENAQPDVALPQTPRTRPPQPSWSLFEILFIATSVVMATAVGYLFFLMLS